MPRVSIVMPVYNGEQYLKESIESILSQTFQDWELWLVNDCSTDSSPQIMEEYTKRDPRVHMLSNLENQKLPRTLNIGFRHAGGEYLTWTSDDNRYKESAIERMVQALEENPSYGMAYSSMEYLQEDGITLTPPTVDLSRICVEDPIGACFLYRREILETVGEYDPDMFLVEDYDYWLRIYKKHKILHIPETLYQYRYHKNSLSMTREREVAAQRHRLRLRELDFLLERAEEREKEILFLDMWSYSSDTWQLRSRFFPGGVLPERLKWMERLASSGNVADQDKPLILFGAGNYGRRALKFYGSERIRYFVDNNPSLQGTMVEGVLVIPFEELLELYQENKIVLTVGSRTAIQLVRQLEEAGIQDFALYCGE